MMNKTNRHLQKTIIFSCILLSGCNWLDNKEEQAQQKFNEEFDEHVYEPMRDGAKELVKDIFNSAADSSLTAEYCAELRPNPLRPASFKDVSKIGYQYAVLLNTPDSLRLHIDVSFFRPTDKFFPVCFPYSLNYSGKTLDYFHLETNYCHYSDLPSPNEEYVYNEIYRLAIYDHYLAMITYDDDLSFMSKTKEGIKYHLIDFENDEHLEYLKLEDFDQDLQKLTPLNDTLLSTSDFISWYKTFRTQ